jgi:single-strand DNA-binding protein
MPGYELTGKVKVVLEPMSFPSGFTKREFVVTTEEDRFPQDIKFGCIKEKIALLDGVKPGQRVTVSFDIRGNESKGRYFVDLAAWRIAAPKANGNAADDDGPPLAEEEMTDSELEGDDFPQKGAASAKGDGTGSAATGDQVPF